MDHNQQLDVSMFDTGDVANMILQRSEVAKSGSAVKNWVKGDGAELLQIASDDPGGIIARVYAVLGRECRIFQEISDEIAPRRIADIGCGYAFADLILFRRYGCEIVLIDIEQSTTRHFGFTNSGAGYSSLAKAREFLEKNGVPSEKINTVNPEQSPGQGDVAGVAPVDFAFSQASCGFHYPVGSYESFFRNQVAPGGGILLDIRNGSGGIGAMKAFGTVSVLEKHRKYSTVVSRKPGG